MRECATPLRTSDGLLFGERPDGTLAHISEVPSGLACRCRCPGCSALLVARKGEHLSHHFGHHRAADERACQTGPETALHRFAKELLARQLALVLPPLQPDGGRQAGYAGGCFRFDTALLEQRLGSIIPDVIARRGDRDLLVEFCVTNACDAAKIEKIASLGLAAVEIDLSGLEMGRSRQELEHAILTEAPRRWLHNPKFYAGSAEPATNPSGSTLPRSIHALQRAYLAACSEVGTIGSRSLAYDRVAADGLSHAVGVEVPGQGCFRVAPHDWQAVILGYVLDRALTGGSTFITTKTALQQIRERGWLRARFSRLSAGEVEALQAALPSFAPPDASIAAWAMILSRRGILVPTGMREQWLVRREALQQVREARHRGLDQAEP
ncbi:hypothetical protein [Methylobacterium durans]|uniref:Competence protein CoiA n=1 Tax=Methylobacterium durans TaxID=2202825 RepID=A0A2U8W5Z5_9HYPH|nr:hypothetical protein [Methylobacterium durans]AWN40706.1 hypothetical protein DK389_09425 [Methylobacterium durans]